MKRGITMIVALVAFLAAVPDATAQQRCGQAGRGGGGQGGCALQARNNDSCSARGSAACQNRGPRAATTQNVGSEVDLTRLWEEEKLAHDVYTQLAESSGLRMFRNISGAELQHMQSVSRLLNPTGGAEDALRNVPGEFSVAEYQDLYDSLVATGTRSPLDAIRVGAKIEDMDIADLQQLIQKATDPRTKQTLERLLQASHNHLRAFASQLERQGASYTPEFLTQSEYDQIVNASGNGRGQHGGNGRGMNSNRQQGGGMGRGPLAGGFGNGGPGRAGQGFGQMHRFGQGRRGR